jgi:hypothetical protein
MRSPRRSPKLGCGGFVKVAGPHIFGDANTRFADLTGVLIDAIARMRKPDA